LFPQYKSLDERIRANNRDEVMTFVMLHLITVAAIDRLSRCLRMNVVGRNQAQQGQSSSTDAAA
jgi:hypothetical protein